MHLTLALAFFTIFTIFANAATAARVVVHVVNAGDQEAPLQLSTGGSAAHSAPANRHRTTVTEDSAALEPLQPAGSGFADTLPAPSLTTYQFTIRRGSGRWDACHGRMCLHYCGSHALQHWSCAPA